MARKPVRGLFITGTDTDVGKTFVGALIARCLYEQGHRVGVYKPAASGCTVCDGNLESDDARILWTAAGSPGSLAEVCPQAFAAPIAPHLAARAEGRTLDAGLLRRGVDVWLRSSDVVLVEGAGGLMSPLGDDEYVADLAYDLGFPLLVVAPIRVGAINQVLQTLITAATFRDGLPLAGIVLNAIEQWDDSARQTSLEIRHRAVAPVLAEVTSGAERFEPPVDWFQLAAEPLSRGGSSANQGA
jgi:dethiobiotin synthetase